MSAVPRSSDIASDSLPGLASAVAWLKTPKRLLIGGEWVEAVSGKTFDTVDPSTEDTLASVAEAGRADIDRAVEAARRAFEAPSWGGMSPSARSRMLLRIADAVEAEADQLAVIETLDNGAPLTANKARALQVAEIFRYYSGFPGRIYGDTNPTDPSKFIYTLREPMGVCGLITAWNTPLHMAAVKTAPALACGNTVVLKPAEQTPLSTMRFGEILMECGLPPGVVNIVPGFGPVAGAAIAEHPGIDKVSFTGSTAVGRAILHASSSNFKRLTMELGGKSPNIVFADSDLAAAAQAAVNGFCRNSGQICSSGTRLFVQEPVYDEVVERVSALASKHKVGNPFDVQTTMGPLISNKQLDRVLSYVVEGERDGAALALGGERVGNVGFFMSPTIFTRVSNQMKIAREEIFGPVLSIIRFAGEDDVVAQANDTEYGLAAAVWTRDVSRAHAIARRLQSGRVWINTYAETDVSMSMGGYKQSGFGREMGQESIEAFTQTKSVYMRL